VLEPLAFHFHQSLDALREAMAQRLDLVRAIDVLLAFLQTDQEVCVVLCLVRAPLHRARTEELGLKHKMKTTIYNEDGNLSGVWPNSMKPMTPGMDEMPKSGFT
jgi:hypothetical protein